MLMMVWCGGGGRLNAPGVPLYRVASTFWSVLRAYLLEFLQGEVFNYLIEEPSCLRKRLASSIIILYCCLDSWTENNCPGYSRVTVYSFCAVLHRTQIVSFWIFFGMVFHARMIDVANIKSRISMRYYLHGM